MYIENKARYSVYKRIKILDTTALYLSFVVPVALSNTKDQRIYL